MQLCDKTLKSPEFNFTCHKSNQEKRWKIDKPLKNTDENP